MNGAGAVTSCAIVLPARNEEVLIGRCLDAATRAVRYARVRRPAVEFGIVVVLDACSDGTADVVAEYPEVRVVPTAVGVVGIVRHLGCEYALGTAAAPPPRCWLACSDADSAVPPEWLTWQLDLADAGNDLVLGTVDPDWDHRTGGRFDHSRYGPPPLEGHDLVYGANLGIRGEMYLRTGGFAAVPEHEDVLLTSAVRSAGGGVYATARYPVVTSGRHTGRTPGGFAGWLAANA